MAHKRWPKGSWMKLESAATLRAIMEQRKMSMARLARYAGCSKSFISALCLERKTTCTPQLAERIAEALEVPLSLLFVVNESAASGRKAQKVSA